MQNPELQAAQLLLERGVSFPVRAPWWMRLFGKKTLSLVIKMPYMGTLYRISYEFLLMGIKKGELDDLSTADAMRVVNHHADAVCRMIASAVWNRRFGALFIGPIAWYLEGHMTPLELYRVYEVVLNFSGMTSFIDTIRLTEAVKVTTPRTDSQSQ